MEMEISLPIEYHYWKHDSSCAVFGHSKAVIITDRRILDKLSEIFIDDISPCCSLMMYLFECEIYPPQEGFTNNWSVMNSCLRVRLRCYLCGQEDWFGYNDEKGKQMDVIKEIIRLLYPSNKMSLEDGWGNKL